MHFKFITTLFICSTLSFCVPDLFLLTKFLSMGLCHAHIFFTLDTIDVLWLVYS